MAQLVERYFDPLRGRLRSRWKIAPDRADDLLQEFLAGPVLEGGLFESARPEKGRFRGFLAKALDRFVSNAQRAARADKRAHHEAPVEMEEDQTPDSGAEPDQAFAVAWARAVLRDALQRMYDHCANTRRENLWLLFDARVLGPTLANREVEAYDALVPRLRLRDAQQAQAMLATAKRMFTRALHSVVAEYESDPKQIKAEIEELRFILASTRGLIDTLGFHPPDCKGP